MKLLYRKGNIVKVRYRRGGLVIEKDRCYYKEKYIRSSDVLYVMDEGYVSTINFDELLVYAIREKRPYNDDQIDVAIFFRSIRTGSFFGIEFWQSDFYLADEIEGEEYFRYYAYEYEEDSTEAGLHNLAIEGEFTLYNTNHYLALRRNTKIYFILNLLK